jgi:adenylate cyclase
VEVSLEAIRSCLEGVVPSTLCTVAPDGTPNVTNLSIVHYVDSTHVALSCQFFNKSRANVERNPRAQVLVVEPHTMRQFRLDLRFDRSERSGALFDRMHARLVAIASLTGMSAVFKLLSADIYQVLECTELATEAPLPAADIAEGRHPPPGLEAIVQLNEALSACGDLDALISGAVDGLVQRLGYEHVVLMLVDGAGERLLTMGSHGYPSSGAGAEVAIGQGPWGVAAQQKRAVRVGQLSRDKRYSEAVRRTAEGTGGTGALERQISLPGLDDPESLMAVPLLYRGELRGMVGLESAEVLRFAHADEAALQLVAGHLAGLIEQALAAGDDAPQARPGAAPAPVGRRVRVRHHADDDSVFIDDRYLIKGLSGRILHRLLSIHLADGRTEFCNRELRLDAELKLSVLRDNLETRLILLRRRLDDRQAPIRLVRSGRGQFRLQVDAAVALDSIG